MPGGSGSSNPNNPDDIAGNVAGTARSRIAKVLSPNTLQLCIETGKYSLELSELDSSLPISDGELFAKMLEQYEHTRHSILPVWARLKKPDKAIFVKV